MTAVLHREVYTEAEAARLLRVPQSTLHYWLDGGRTAGAAAAPFIFAATRSSLRPVSLN